MKKNTLMTWAVCLSVWLGWVAGLLAEPNLTRPGHIPDPDFSRDTVYHVRAIEEDTPTINARNLRTTFDQAGRAVDITTCYDDFKTRTADQCLSLVGRRAWPSPISVDYGER